LAPGSYTLEAQALMDGSAASKPRTIAVRLEPKLHQTSRFWLLLIGSISAFALGGGGWLWWQRRRARAFAEERAREWRELQEESGLLERPEDSSGDPP
ncbi:MAG: hypothetical protein AAF725_01315, partial [Acidobacteriota bacterium]